MNQEEKINWDKLFGQLEQSSDVSGNEELNQEELEMLLLAEEIHMRLKEEDVQLRFPVREGWEELQRRYQKKTAKIKRLKLYRVLTAAAAIVVVLLPALWLLRHQNKSNSTVASNQIQLTLANGKTVAIDDSRSEDLKAEGLVLNGSGLVYKKENIVINDQLEPQMNVLSVPDGKYTRLELGDGTKVWVNAGSKLSYPVPFSSDKREVTLEGEAYFDVSHNAKRPFVVHAKSLAITVLGTAFGVSTFGNKLTTALERGKVSLQAGNQSLLLSPGELGVYNEEHKSLTKSETDLRLYTAWKDLDIYFNESTLQEITSRLEREYNVNFVFEKESLQNLHFTIDMPKNVDLMKILNNIKLSSDQVDFVMKDNEVRVKQR